MSKRLRTLENFFSPPPVKRAKAENAGRNSGQGQHDPTPQEYSKHLTYPFSVPGLPASLRDALNFAPAEEGRPINDQPDLDLVYYQPYIPKEVQRDLFQFLRDELFFYRVKYTIKRGPVDTQINTPRYTTVFGIDETARFNQNGVPVDALTSKVLPRTAYKCQPRPIPDCLDVLRQLTENATGCKFNFSLVNYYASGDDSISYHSDDERFLGVDPAIASFSLGAKRDFLMKHKPTPAKDDSESTPMKLPLASGDMILMRGKTQSNWLHSIPKRKGGDADKGRINITFRRAMVKGGTENYYRYNVGDGEAYKWDNVNREMSVWKPS
ncbi:uncharacterized protein MYCFIDRAFT_29190 [Pseudocercospora fijiensis CIRAD86]|uniref:Fe2OG dioxygenase domain-containing protein n=1 Tax=Pseudocercospora fijiensis (strain CIRAD86) TaxID=383855 RepID=N1QAL1_PSEFD|nr:uncharacterized protein MYCFIDRAFT_29190 [Pseudocercospora fijiensis CIRAD86]EME88012.1 hypothetical protein MYCFIDRAFT_29190 [Pseudocercospora fijiensis CIRAD86]